MSCLQFSPSHHQGKLCSLNHLGTYWSSAHLCCVWCMYICVCVCVWDMCVHVDARIRCLLQWPSTFWDRVYPWTGRSLCWLFCLAIDIWGPSCLFLTPGLGLQAHDATISIFTWTRGIWAQALMLAQQAPCPPSHTRGCNVIVQCVWDGTGVLTQKHNSIAHIHVK